MLHPATRISVADTESGVMYNEGDETGEKLVAELEAQGVTCVSKNSSLRLSVIIKLL